MAIVDEIQADIFSVTRRIAPDQKWFEKTYTTEEFEVYFLWNFSGKLRSQVKDLHGKHLEFTIESEDPINWADMQEKHISISMAFDGSSYVNPEVITKQLKLVSDIAQLLSKQFGLPVIEKVSSKDNRSSVYQAISFNDKE